MIVIMLIVFLLMYLLRLWLLSVLCFLLMGM